MHILITNLNSDCGIGDVTTVPLGSGLEGSLSSPSVTSVPLAHASVPELKGNRADLLCHTYCTMATLHTTPAHVHSTHDGGGEVARFSMKTYMRLYVQSKPSCITHQSNRSHARHLCFILWGGGGFPPLGRGVVWRKWLCHFYVPKSSQSPDLTSSDCREIFCVK